MVLHHIYIYIYCMLTTSDDDPIDQSKQTVISRGSYAPYISVSEACIYLDSVFSAFTSLLELCLEKVSLYIFRIPSSVRNEFVVFFLFFSKILRER